MVVTEELSTDQTLSTTGEVKLPAPSPELRALANSLLYPDVEKHPSNLAAYETFWAEYVGNANTPFDPEAHEFLRETHHGLREYSMLCGAMIDAENSKICVVRKDPFIDNRHSSDWLVTMFDFATGEITEEKVIQAQVESHPEGDKITLLLAVPEKREYMYHPPFELTLSVDQNYKSDDKPMQIGHYRYYGRGTSPQMTIDNTFATSNADMRQALDLARENGPLPETLSHQAQQDLGHMALFDE